MRLNALQTKFKYIQILQHTKNTRMPVVLGFILMYACQHALVATVTHNPLLQLHAQQGGQR